MPTCSSRRSPRPFTAGIPPILGTEPGVSSASAGTGGGQWAGARGEEVEGGAGRTEGSWLENPRALQGPRDWTLRGGPSTWGPVLAGGRAALPASSQVPSWGPRPPWCVHVRTHARARTGKHAPEERTHMHTCDLHTHACMRAHTRTLTVHSRTHVRTHLHTHHTYAHTHPQAEPRGPWGATWEVGRLARPQTCRRPGPWAWQGHTGQQWSHKRHDPDPPGPGSAHCTPCTAELTCTPRHPLPGPAQTLQTPG